MSKQQVIDVMKSIDQWIEKSDCFTSDGRSTRLIILAVWINELTRGSISSFWARYDNYLTGPYGDEACDVMDEVFQRLNINTIDELKPLLLVA